MTDELRTLIETTLADASGLCLDNRDDCEKLTEMLVERLRPETTEPLLILQVDCWMRWDDVRPSTDAYHRSVYAAVDRALAEYDHVWLWRVVDADGRRVADYEDAWVADRRRALRGPEARNQDGDGPYPVQPEPVVGTSEAHP